MSTPSVDLTSSRPVGISVPQAFTDIARRHAQNVAVRIRTHDDEAEFTYSVLAEHISRLCSTAFATLHPGERVVLALPGGEDFIAAFLGALQVGAIPVPVYLPSAHDPQRYLARAQGVIADCAPAAVATTTQIAAAVDKNAVLHELPAVLVDDPECAHGDGNRTPRAGDSAAPEAVAFIQYSSGSTGRPKGVLNTHASILRQVDVVSSIWNAPEPMHTVSWLPPYHDMGLFWGLLVPLLTGGSATLIPPHDFVRDPRIWLATVSDVRGNWIAGPDFGYRQSITAFHPDDVENLDLGSLRIASNGAEPVRADTVRRFTEHFAPAGLADSAMCPQYGLAEAGLAVSGTTVRRRWHQQRFDADELRCGRAVPVDRDDSRPARTVVSCGNSTLGWDVRIVDPDNSRTLPDGRIGEIWIAGPGLPIGYWQRETDTAQVFGAHTHEGAGPFLRTGDAGFRLRDELYITGRYRDLIIVGGMNHFPNDIETTAESAHDAIAPAGTCAVQPESGDQSWVLVVETAGPEAILDDIGRAVHRRILTEHRTAPERVIFVPPKTLPLTTSGKIRRREVAARVSGNSLPVLWETAAAAVGNPRRSDTARFVAALLGVRPDELDVDADLVGYGWTSAMTAQLMSWAAERDSFPTFAALYTEPTVRRWDDLIERCRTTSAPTPVRVLTGGESGTTRTTALQRAFWIGRDARQPLGGVGCRTYFELRGSGVDPSRLHDALRELVWRHPMLRARFPGPDECIIDPASNTVDLPVHDLAGDADREAHLRAVRERLRDHRFDPVTGDCWRIEFTRSGEATIIHLAVDMTIADVTGIGILVADLAALYRGEQPGAPGGLRIEPPAPEPSRPAGQSADTGSAPQLPLRTEAGPHFRRLSAHLSHDVLRGLDTAGRAVGVTRAVILLAAYELVLHRWSTEPQFTVTVTTTGRTPATAHTVGDFTALHTHHNTDPTGRSWAEYMRDTQQAFRANLPDLDSGVGRWTETTLRRSPLVFTYAADHPVIDAAALSTLGSARHISSTTPQTLIDNQCCLIGTEVQLSWDFRAGRFPAGVVEDMFDSYLHLLSTLSACDWHEPATVDIPPHTRRTRADVNATDGPIPAGLLYDAFTESAASAPDRPALRWSADEYRQRPALPAWCVPAQPTCLTYGELDRYARAFASELRAHHQPGAVVGIRLPKGPGQIIAVLATLMAGCTYLPISTDQPPHRLERISSRSGMRALVHDDEFCSGATTLVGVTGHSIDIAPGHLPGPPTRVDPAAPAYIIYTSGSTGEPKGVAISHSAALNTIVDVNRRNDIDGRDALIALSSLDFDLSVYDIFGPLSVGATIVTIADDTRRDAFRWCELIRAFDITVWNTVPALLEMLLTACGPHRPPQLTVLRRVLLSGDWIPLNLPAKLRAHSPDAQLVAMGGATEAAIWSNEFRVDDVDPHWTSVPYGRPLTNQCYRVVAPDGRDQPDLVPGELWIGGTGVALGYHNDPHLTQQRFHEDRTGRRWYKTGDLGCYLPDGVLVFLGRADSQVKIRGHRIECGEIEQILRTHPAIENAVVVPIHDRTRLGCLLVTAAGCLSDTEEIRTYVAARLPGYMVPRVFRQTATIPHSVNGKVDRRAAARSLEQGVSSLPAEGISPTEQCVGEVWAQALGVAPQTLRTDSKFFDSGGDSLRATEVCRVLSARGVLGADVELLLTSPTLRDFAAHCVMGNDFRTAAADPRTPDDAVGSGPFPLTRLQQAYVVAAGGLRGVPRAPTALVAVLGAATTVPIDINRLEGVLTAAVREFDMLRCHLDTDVAQAVDTNAWPVRIERIGDVPDDPDSLTDHLAGLPMPMDRRPLLRCYATNSEPRHIALLINYLGLDARSLDTVITAIMADYDGSPRPVRIAARADVFRRFATTAIAETRTAAPAPPPPHLPPSWSATTTDGTAVGAFTRRSFVLTPAESTRLRSLATAADVTATAVVLEAFTHTLYRHGSGPRFAVTIPRAHRPDYAPVHCEVLGNFTRPYLCEADYADRSPGSEAAVADTHRRLNAIVASATDGTAQIAEQQLRERQPGYPVVFTSTLGLSNRRAAEFSLNLVRTLTRTPGVLLDCQVEDYDEGIRISWDTADCAVRAAETATAFDDFERAVRCRLRSPATTPATVEHHDRDENWPLLVIAAALHRLDHDSHRPVSARYAPVVARWRRVAGHQRTAPTDSAAAAGALLAEIVTGTASYHALLAHPLLAPESLLLSDAHVRRSIDTLAERVVDHAREQDRPLRVIEIGGRTGHTAQRLLAAMDPVVADYVAVEPHPVLRAIAAERHITGVRHIGPDQIESAEPFDIVLCCGSIHQMDDRGRLLSQVPMRADGWLWLTEHCSYTPATLISAAVIDPDLLGTQPLTADQWWHLLHDRGWTPTTMTAAGPGVTLFAHRAQHPVADGGGEPRPQHAQPTAGAPPADNPELAILTDLWQHYLGVRPQPGDDFFLLGGDSLQATRIYTRLRELGYRQVAMVDLFNHPVLSALADHIGRMSPLPGEPPGPESRGPASPARTYPLTSVQRAYAIGRQAGYLLSGVAAHCYFEFATTALDSSRFTTAATALVRRHPGLRTTVSGTVATVHDDPIEPVVRVLDDVRAGMRDQVIDLSERGGLDIAVQYLDSDRSRALIGISMDNMLLDGASMMTVLAELDHLYRGRPIEELPPITTTFADHVRNTAPDPDAASDGELTAAQQYWLRRLHHLPSAPALVTPDAMAAVSTPRFERARARIARDTWAEVTTRCRSRAVTPAALLLACYARVIAAWSDTPDFCLNVTMFDRATGEPGIDNVIGDFTSLLLLECHVEPGTGIWDAAQAIQRQLISDLAHRAADGVWVQKQILGHHGDPAAAMFPVVFTSGLGLRTIDTTAGFGFGDQTFAVSQTPQTLLDFQVWEDGGALQLSWDHVAQLIPEDTAVRYLARLSATIESAATDTDRPDTLTDRIRGICAAVLHRPSVAPDANFFQIGGDSVAATAVVERVRREAGPGATLRLLLAHPVIADFALAVAQATTHPTARRSAGNLEEGVL
ncbi:amino acid adenylation domain-containing protein [Nocardia sp. BSTN01]|uniref:non-ribosomal peptide synthetase n=1 Tax=Nocardia sp. BSTN01 TaxID=2783665 RepID=UPI00188FF2D4|nr:non-ribosomal peptide synthetase [Nocardia sp. BSTN01]MBF4998071.1 amino acid adenylation domain-containing protein [Nocardia sp. BSTN01]